MKVAISDFKPNVKCNVAPVDIPEWESCVIVFKNMRASKRIRVFGSSGDEAVEEELPLVLEAGKYFKSSSIPGDSLPHQ